jgi:hypothetical protein
MEFFFRNVWEYFYWNFHPLFSLSEGCTVTNFIFFSDLDQSFDDDCDGKLVIAEGDDLDIKPDDLDRKECLQHFYSLLPDPFGVLLLPPNFATPFWYWYRYLVPYLFDIFDRLVKKFFYRPVGTGSRKLHN